VWRCQAGAPEAVFGGMPIISAAGIRQVTAPLESRLRPLCGFNKTVVEAPSSAIRRRRSRLDRARFEEAIDFAASLRCENKTIGIGISLMKHENRSANGRWLKGTTGNAAVAV
jgi:hypothetical protein